MIAKLVKIIFHNLWYKLGSLFLALLIWGIVQGEEVLEVNRRVKVNISVAEGFAIKGRNYRYVDVTLRGPRVLMGELATKPLEAKVFIPDGERGNIEIPFAKDLMKDWDDRVKLIARDSYITVFVDEKIKRNIPIREVLQGVPAEGFFIEKVQIKPDRVEVSGVKSDVSRLEEIVTEPIDISGINQSKGLEVTLATQNLSYLEYASDSVRVQIQVGDSKINRRFNAISLDPVGSEYVAVIKPKQVSITLQGTPSVLGFVQRADMRAFVELTGLSPGRYERDIQVKIPGETVLIDVSPKKALVEVTPKRKD